MGAGAGCEVAPFKQHLRVMRSLQWRAGDVRLGCIGLYLQTASLRPMDSAQHVTDSIIKYKGDG